MSEEIDTVETKQIDGISVVRQVMQELNRCALRDADGNIVPRPNDDATCDNCKWWTRFDYGKNFSPAQGECQNRKVDFGTIDSATANSNGMEGHQLMTGPKFGCIHHEIK